MIHELAIIEVVAGKEAAFEAAVQQAVPLFQDSKGCRSLVLQRETERPGHYRLHIGWDTLEDHTVGFRGSDNFKAWRALINDLIASPPDVKHVQDVFTGF